MNDYHFCYICVFAALIQISDGKIIKNKLYSEPKAICGANEITVQLETDLPFSGNVYAKGYFNREACRVQGDGIGNTVNITIPINADCGMRRRRMVSKRSDQQANPKGIIFETTVVVMFHKLFLTKADKAFHIECRYAQTNEIYTQKLEVSNLPPTEIPSVNDAEASAPKCKYEVLEGNENGPPLSFAAIGQPVYHHWVCETASADMHCLTVHSCMVDDGQGAKQELLDNDGCPIEPDLLDTIEYKGDLEASRQSFVFKFADKPTVFFSCQLRVEPKDADTGRCVRTSDHCASTRPSESLDTSSPVSIEPDFPRPSTPKFKATTEATSMDMPPNSSEDLSGEVIMMEPETTTMMMKKKKIKARRPPRTLKDDDLSLPEFVGLQHDLGIRRKPPSPNAIEMDVNAGAVEVIDPPELPVRDPENTVNPPNVSVINHELIYNKVCFSRPLIVNALIGSTFVMLFILSIAVYLYWHCTKPLSKSSDAGQRPRESSPSSSNSRSIRAFNDSL